MENELIIEKIKRFKVESESRRSPTFNYTLGGVYFITAESSHLLKPPIISIKEI